MTASPAEKSSLLKLTSFAPIIAGVISLNLLAISVAVIGRVSPGESSIASSARCDPDCPELSVPGPC